jgi:hypothetical protein
LEDSGGIVTRPFYLSSPKTGTIRRF